MCEVEKPKVPIFGKKYFKSVRKGSKDAEKLFLTGLENGKKKKKSRILSIVCLIKECFSKCFFPQYGLRKWQSPFRLQRTAVPVSVLIY